MLLFQRSLASLIVTESVTVFKNRIYHCIGERQVPPKGERIKDTWSLRASMEAGTLLFQGSLASLIVTESVTVFKNRIYHCIGENRSNQKENGSRTHGRYASMEAGTLLFQRSLASLIVTESVTVFKNRIYHCIGERQIPPKGERIKDTWSLCLHGSRYATFSKVTSISDSDRVCHCI